MSGRVRLDRLVGRKVLTANNRLLGRVEEFRAERRGHGWVITGYVVGSSGLFERLGLGVRLLLGMKHGGGFIVRWDQLDVTHPERPRLVCAVEDLRRA